MYELYLDHTEDRKGANSMDSIIGFILRIVALAIFILCLDGIIPDAHVTRAIIGGWGALICAGLEDIKEILKNDRDTKLNCDRNR